MQTQQTFFITDKHFRYALVTQFVIFCKGWKDHDPETSHLLYRFWSLPVGYSNNERQLLYYGPDPETPPSQFQKGLAEYDYRISVKVRIANPLGEYVEVELYVVVKEEEEKAADFEDKLLNLTSGSNSELSNLIQAGKGQEAKQMIVALASLINTEPITNPNKEADTVWQNVTANPSSLTTRGDTKIESTTNEAQRIAEEEKQRKAEEEAKVKRVKLRTNIVTTLASETQTPTFDSLQQTAFAFKAITQQTDELSDTTQNLTVGAIDKLSESFSSYLEGTTEVSSSNAIQAAGDIISTASNVLIAAKAERATEISKENEIYAGKAETSNSEQQDVPAKTPEEKQKEKEAVKLYAEKVFGITDDIVKSVMDKKLPGEPAVVIETQLMMIKAQRQLPNEIGRSELAMSAGSFKTPSSNEIIGVNSTEEFIDTKVLQTESNAYVWDDSAKFITSPVLELSYSSSNGTEISVKDTTELFVIDFDVNPDQVPEETLISPTLSENQTLYIRAISVRSNESSVHIIIRPENEETLDVFIGVGYLPTTDKYDLNSSVPHDLGFNSDNDTLDNYLLDELRHTVFIPVDIVQSIGSEGTIYIGVRGTVNDSTESSYEDDYYDDYFPSEEDAEEPEVIQMNNFTLRVITSGCRYWDKDADAWVTDGCIISPLSNSRFTRCFCNHLTSFGSDFFVGPNIIHFDTVFDDLGAKLAENNAVLVTICLMIFLYVVISIWARRKDKQDINKWGVRPLADNSSEDKYHYMVSAYTGMRKGAGTRSRIFFIVAGEFSDTGVRELGDSKTKHKNRGSILHYLMTVQSPLGPLNFARIWHDNSGQGKSASWFLDRFVVVDLQTNETFFFLANRWLAVEEDDGMIDRTLPVASQEDMSTFGALFTTATRRRLTDSHLWVSVVSRPSRSSFTRVQRLGVILSLVFTTMISNAMFFRADEKKESADTLTLGPFTFAASQLWISFVSSLIVLPVNLIIDQLFRRSALKHNKVKAKRVEKGPGFFNRVKTFTCGWKNSNGKDSLVIEEFKSDGRGNDSKNDDSISNHDLDSLFTISRPPSAVSNCDEIPTISDAGANLSNGATKNDEESESTVEVKKNLKSTNWLGRKFSNLLNTSETSVEEINGSSSTKKKKVPTATLR